MTRKQLGYLRIAAGFVILMVAIGYFGAALESGGYRNLPVSFVLSAIGLAVIGWPWIRKAIPTGRSHTAEKPSQSDRANEIRAALTRLQVFDEETGSQKRAALTAHPERSMLFRGGARDAVGFVSLMVDLTEDTLQQIDAMERVDVRLAILENIFRIDYFQNWSNGAVNAYGEEVIRTGEDVYEVFGGSKSAERMAAAWR